MVKRSTWILIIILVLLVTITMVIRNIDLGDDDDETTTVEFLYFVESTEIISVEVKSTEGASIKMIRDDQGAWQLIQPESPNVDINRINTMVTQLARVRVFATLEDPPSDEDIGLDSPLFHIVIGFTDGSQGSFDVGLENAIGNGYYIRMDSGTIMVVSISNLESLLGMIEDPPVIAPTPTEGPTETQINPENDEVDVTLTPAP